MPDNAGMSFADEYLGRVNAIVWETADLMPSDALANVRSLLEHGEPAEGMCELAWVIVNQRVRVPQDLISRIRKHAEGIVDPAHMPSNLDEFAN